MQIRLKGTRARAASLGMCLFLTLASSEAVRAQAPPIYKVDVPIYKVDPSWPKLPLPNKWMMQGVPTMVVDKDDHVWVISRLRDITPDESGAGKTPPRNDCCVAAPAILEFDPQGNLLKSWGGPGYVPGWPAPESIVQGRSPNTQSWWIKQETSGCRAPPGGTASKKFTSDGKFLWDFGHRGTALGPEQRAKAAAGVSVDFIPNNPGSTLFHCHMQLHMDFGFMQLLQLSLRRVREPRPLHRRIYFASGLASGFFSLRLV